MNLWDMASQSISRSICTAEYFGKLIAYFDKKCVDVQKNNERLMHQAETPGIVLLAISKLDGTDVNGAAFTEYKGRSRSLKLYCNWPVGYVLAEMVQVVPFTGKRDAWAVKVERDDFYETWTLKAMPDFLGGNQAVIPLVGDFLLERLLTEELTEEALHERSEFKE